jgi:YHS domain-containing protein
MKRLLNSAILTLLVVLVGCATGPKETAQDSGPIATCYVCRYNNDLACLTVKVKDTTPRADYQGQTYCFCSEDCREAFVKKPGKYVSKSSGNQPFER